jgi:MoaD family protein
MNVKVRVPAALRELSGGQGVLALDLRDAATIDDVLDAIGSVHPALERRVRNEQRELRVHVNVFVGEENIRALAGANTKVQAGDEVSIIPAISGG